MSISFIYDKEANAIRATCDTSLSDKEIRDYFNKLLARKNEISGADEFVDFTRVEHFDTSHTEFSRIKHLYETIAEEKIIVRTVFKVANPYQFGMARLFSGLVEASGAQFDFEFEGWRPT